ncbi:MAG: hypothetical protein KQJ78_03235 [Deltaproteobacteria bacterium]|nr:hypothetical protein [Deltaproteobacteria bacterium]
MGVAPGQIFRQCLNLSRARTLSGLGRDILRQLADEGEIICGRTPGGHRRWNRESLDAYLSRGEIQALAIARSLGL